MPPRRQSTMSPLPPLDRARPPQRMGSAPKPSEQPLPRVEVLDGTDTARPSGTRVASRLTLTSMLLVAVVVATMGTAFALESWNVSKTLSLFGRGPSSSASVAATQATHTSAPQPSPDVSHAPHDPGAAVSANGSCDPGTSHGRGTPNAHASANARHQQRCDAGQSGAPDTPPAHGKPNHHGHGTPNGQGQQHKPAKTPSSHAHQGAQGNGGGGDGPNGPPADGGGAGGSGSSDAHGANGSGH